MVTDLEKAMEASGESPEAQWRTRILIRSSQDSERDITKRLYEIETSGRNSQHSRGQMAMRKLRRDFSRVHRQYLAAMKTFERRQQVEVSFLSCAEDGERKEEFFDRAMREREEEINNIHYSMNKVNAIYEDLAGLVDDQQEQIDRLVENVEESKANTRQGMEHIHEAISGMCGQHKAGQDVQYWSMESFLELTTNCHSSLNQCAEEGQASIHKCTNDMTN